MISLSNQSKVIETTVDLPASKSISNRLLIIHFLMKQTFKIEHLSDCDDTNNLNLALKNINAKDTIEQNEYMCVDVGEAGTSFRFLTALLAIISGKYKLVGTSKLLQRPIAPLVDALNQLGANINFENNKIGSALLIDESKIVGGDIDLDASISSQFITALMLVAPYFTNGLTIHLKGKIVSTSYIILTKKLMIEFGADVEFIGNTIHIKPVPYQYHHSKYFVESDWTAASYWFAFAALSNKANIFIKGLKENSYQGDALVAPLFNIYGIQSSFFEDGLQITKSKHEGFIHIFDFIDNPDLVQTFAFLNAALDLPLQVNQAANLIHKETNRIEALSNELSKIGVELVVKSNDDFAITCKPFKIQLPLIFKTYQDHRMAMSAAILAMKFDSIQIANSEVVLKSYPNFWNHLSQAGFTIRQIKG